MKVNYSKERKERIGSLNKGKNLSLATREIMRIKALQRDTEVREKYRKASSKPVIVFNQEGSIHERYPGIRVMAKAYKCCHKTINKAIKDGTLFKGQWIVKYDNN